MFRPGGDIDTLTGSTNTLVVHDCEKALHVKSSSFLKRAVRSSWCPQESFNRVSYKIVISERLGSVSLNTFSEMPGSPLSISFTLVK